MLPPKAWYLTTTHPCQHAKHNGFLQPPLTDGRNHRLKLSLGEVRGYCCGSGTSFWPRKGLVSVSFRLTAVLNAAFSLRNSVFTVAGFRVSLVWTMIVDSRAVS